METNLELSVYQSQVMLLNKVNLAFEEYMELIINVPEIEMIFTHSREDVKKHLVADVKSESLKMLIVNYSMALLGRGRNDKVSVFNNQLKIEDEQSRLFCCKYIKELDELKIIRNKIYAHHDLDWHNHCKGITNEFISQCIQFVACVLKNSKETKEESENYDEIVNNAFAKTKTND